MKRTLKPTTQQQLEDSSLWKNQLKEDCISQNVFFAVRENRVDFYHKGGSLFKFENNEYKTHIKYAAVIATDDDDEKNYLSEKQLSAYKLPDNFEDRYERIKENCSKYSGIEALGVSDIYHRHSFLSDSDVVVLDIEVSFKSSQKGKKQDRIDIVFLNKKTKSLQFVEAKDFTNKEIRSKGKPKVLGQLNKYEAQIKRNKTEILSEYGNLVISINDIFGISLPTPEDIDEKVTLLIFGFDGDQRDGKLKELKENPIYKGVKIYAKGNSKDINPATIWNAKTVK